MMTVAIILSDPQTEADVLFYAPVVAQSVFDEIWVPAAESLGLYWMPAFSTGTVVSYGNLPAVRQEFIAMRDWFDANIRDRESVEFLMRRASLAVTGLDQIMARPDEVELFVG